MAVRKHMLHQLLVQGTARWSAHQEPPAPPQACSCTGIGGACSSASRDHTRRRGSRRGAADSCSGGHGEPVGAASLQLHPRQSCHTAAAKESVVTTLSSTAAGSADRDTHQLYIYADLGVAILGWVSLSKGADTASPAAAQGRHGSIQSLHACS